MVTACQKPKRSIQGGRVSEKAENRRAISTRRGRIFRCFRRNHEEKKASVEDIERWSTDTERHGGRNERRVDESDGSMLEWLVNFLKS